MCKLRRYPSGQWSRGGNKFKDMKKVQAMLQKGWIGYSVTINQDVDLFDITSAGREALKLNVHQ